jgi:SAM-dependent methyltransferase
MNINTKSYWNNRFVSGDWEQKKGRLQTRAFANSQVSKLNIPSDFSGTILDFGCGLGDAMPIYHKAYPKAKLIGLDISEEAIKKCCDKYGHIAEFICGDYKDVPKVDIIISSNVFEHLSNDKLIAKHLLDKCQQLNIIVPYQEYLVPDNEHVNSYTSDYYKDIGLYQFKVFKSKGWGYQGLNLVYQVYLKNIIRPFFNKPLAVRQKQILFIFEKAS